MIREFRKKLSLWLYPQSKRLGEVIERELELDKKIIERNLEIAEKEALMRDASESIKKEKERMKLYRNLLNTKIVSLENVDEEIRYDIEQNCHLFITKDSSQLMFRHMLSWYVNDSLFDHGENITDDFFRGTINGIQMVRQFMEDQSTSHDNRHKQKK